MLTDVYLPRRKGALLGKFLCPGFFSVSILLCQTQRHESPPHVILIKSKHRSAHLNSSVICLCGCLVKLGIFNASLFLLSDSRKFSDAAECLKEGDRKPDQGDRTQRRQRSLTCIHPLLFLSVACHLCKHTSIQTLTSCFTSHLSVCFSIYVSVIQNTSVIIPRISFIYIELF